MFFMCIRELPRSSTTTNHQVESMDQVALSVDRGGMQTRGNLSTEKVVVMVQIGLFQSTLDGARLIPAFV